MSLENNKPVQKIIIGGDRLQKSILVDKEIETDPPIISATPNSESDSFENVKIPSSHIIETEEETKKSETISQSIENDYRPQETNNLIKDEETLKMLKSLNFWSKFHIILGFISAGMLFLSGLAYLFLIVTIPLSIIYWIIAGVSVWLLTYLYRSFSKFNELRTVKTQEDFNNNVLQGLNLMKSYYKITGIFSIISLILASILIILGIVFLVLYSSNPEFQSFLASQQTMK
jgi:hypothetical protein